MAQSEVFILIEPHTDRSIELERARDKVAKEWNIIFQEQARGYQSQMVEDSIALHNGMTYYQLAEKYGSDWQKKFDEAVERELNRSPDMTEILQLTHNQIEEHNRMVNRLCQEVWYETNTPYSYQKEVGKTVLEGSNTNVLFRFSDNVLRFHLAGDTRYEFNTNNCQISKYAHSRTLYPMEFNIQTFNESKEAFLQIISSKGDTTNFTFEVMYAPIPSFQFAEIREDQNIAVSSLTANDSLFMAFPADISITGHQYTIVEWEIQYKDKRVGNVQKTHLVGEEVLNIIRNLPLGSNVTIFYKSKSQNGIFRSNYKEYTLTQ